MPTPRIAKPISVTAANAHSGATVKAYNRTTGESTSGLISSGKAMLDMQNLTSGFTVGDVIVFNITGAYYGSNTVTLTAATAKPQDVTITLIQSTATNAPGIVF